MKQLQDRAQDSPAFIHPQRTFADIVINFLPPEEDLEETGAHLNVRHILRPTLPHPDLTPILESGASNGIHLELARDLDGKPVDVLEIAGHIDDRSARRVEDLLWELIPEASHLREHVGAFADRTNQQAKSYPLALTQLLIAYHMVKAAHGRARRLRETTMISHARALAGRRRRRRGATHRQARWRTPCARSRWTPWRERSRGIRACRWAWRTWRRCCSPASSSSIPSAPDWPDRDRFVLSAGHGSMLLYALLYLTGYEDMTLDELMSFRQLGARTAGHPEFGHASGIETTTGPLGQGISNAVGMALAERMLAARHGRALVDHRTYVIASDGDLMEGISHEACSLAGHLGLGRLIVLFDDNGISIDGPTSLACSDDVLGRFEAYGWQAVGVDGHDMQAVAGAIEAAQRRPAPFADRVSHGDRLRRAQQAGNGGDPWRAARRGRDRSGARAARLAPSAFRGSGACARCVACCRRAWLRGAQGLAAAARGGRCVGAPPFRAGARG